MTKAYLNYPNPRMTVHGDPACIEIGKMGKAGQRNVSITLDSFTSAINQLNDKTFRLESSASMNDLWLSVDFRDPVFEGAVADYILRLLGERYSPLQDVRIKRHC